MTASRGSAADSDGDPTDSTTGDRPSDTDLLAVSAEHPILLFDGVCNLCNRWIQFVIARDPDAIFRFAPLQSDVARTLLSETDYAGEQLDSVVLVEDGTLYTKSDAVIRTARHLGGIYHLLRPTAIVPTRLRNLVYDFVANRRYRWFGKRDACMMPTPDVEERFLAGGPGPDAED